MNQAVVIHAAKDLRVEDFPVDPVGPDQVLVKIAAGGICGSDLHYYSHGGFGAIRVKQPMVLGHEISGTIHTLGANVSHLKTGTKVAVCPSRPCNHCRFCLEGNQQHCLDMRFYGSAMRFPHVQGGFRQWIVCDAPQLHPISDTSTLEEAAFAEPLAVTLHAARRAGPLLGKRVLITGSGPIGALCVLSARRAGAAEIVITDISDAPLATALKVGADRGINTAKEPTALAGYNKDKGYFDVLFEASGNSRALTGAFEALRPGAVIVQCGMGDDFTIPISTVVAKEFEIRGTFRFHEEFALAVTLIDRRLIDVRPLLSQIIPVSDAVRAFELAGDRSKVMKVQLAF